MLSEIARLGQYFSRCTFFYSYAAWGLGQSFMDNMARCASILQAFGWVVVNADQHYEAMKVDRYNAYHFRRTTTSAMCWTDMVLKTMAFSTSFVLPTFWVIEAKSAGFWPRSRTLPSQIMSVDPETSSVEIKEISDVLR